MTHRVSYYPKSLKVLIRACLLACFISSGFISVPVVLPVQYVSAKPMPAIESAWVAIQAGLALEALDNAQNISAIEQRDVASRWVQNISWIIAESEIDPEELAQTHNSYALERDSQIPKNHIGPRPHGGVAGTRIGIKCLHAHYANWLVNGQDVVGAWVAKRLAE